MLNRKLLGQVNRLKVDFPAAWPGGTSVSEQNSRRLPLILGSQSLAHFLPVAIGAIGATGATTTARYTLRRMGWALVRSCW